MAVTTILKRRLQRTLAQAQNLEDSTRSLISQIEIADDRIDHLQDYFLKFSESLFSFFQEIRIVAGTSQETRAILETSIRGKIAEITMLFEIDGIDYINIARHLRAARDKEVMLKVIQELLGHEDGLEKAEWLYEALMRVRQVE